LALAYIAFDKFMPSSGRDAALVETATQQAIIKQKTGAPAGTLDKQKPRQPQLVPVLQRPAGFSFL